MDEEICFDYTMGSACVSNMEDKSDRQNYLKTNLGFDCLCTKCVDIQSVIDEWVDVD